MIGIQTWFELSINYFEDFPKKSIKTPFGALNFQKFGQRFPTPV
jgi:hypothetical protein